jgi:hypothetical protein
MRGRFDALLQFARRALIDPLGRLGAGVPAIARTSGTAVCRARGRLALAALLALGVAQRREPPESQRSARSPSFWPCIRTISAKTAGPSIRMQCCGSARSAGQPPGRRQARTVRRHSRHQRVIPVRHAWRLQRRVGRTPRRWCGAARTGSHGWRRHRPLPKAARWCSRCSRWRADVSSGCSTKGRADGRSTCSPLPRSILEKAMPSSPARGAC